MASFNEFMQGITKGVDEIVYNISSSNFYKNVIPTRENFTQELINGIGSNQKAKISFVQDSIDMHVKNQVHMHLRKMDPNIQQTVGDEIANALHGTDYSEEAFEKLGEIMRKHQIDDSIISNFTNKTPSKIQDIINAESIGIDKVAVSLDEGLKHPLLYAKTYFNNPDPKIKQQRIAAVAGTYGTLAVGGRLLSGGTITEDNYGRRDIAGIPFI